MRKLRNIGKPTGLRRSVLRLLFAGLLSTALFSLPGFSDEAFKLSGIMAGDKPAAIVNDQIVSVGDWVQGVQILSIGPDHVICQGKQGTFGLQLNVSVSPVVTTQNAAAVQTKADIVPAVKKIIPAAPSDDPVVASIPSNVRRYMDQSLEYLKDVDQLLKSPLVSERLYTKAAELCDLADREAQQVFRFPTGGGVRLSVKNHIDKVRQVKSAILKQKADFTTHIRSLVAEHQIKTGMTARDVVSSWGAPLMQNRDGQSEKWIYQDNNGNQKELIFRDGILIGY